MLAVAASRMGFRTHVFEPQENPPASHVSDLVTTAAYEDTEALSKFARSVDVITFEFENIPTEALNIVEAICNVLPARNALKTSQDRLIEKEFLTKYFGANTFVGNPSEYFDIKNLSSGNDSKVEAFIADLKKEGYSINKKSYSDFTSLIGVKKKNKHKALCLISWA